MSNFLALCNSTGTPAWRVWPIFKELEKQGHNTHYTNLISADDTQYEAILNWADVIVFQMIAAEKLLKDARAQGIYTIFDCDDLIEEVPKRHPNYDTTQDRHYQGLFKRMVKNVDLITVSTPLLAEHYKKYSSNVITLPNYLPDEFWERKHAPNQSKTLRFGWAGSIGRPDDLELISPVIKRLLKESPKSKFVYTGGGGWSNGKPDVWRFGEDSFKDIPYFQKEFSPGSPIEVWPDRLNGMRLDIAISPLADSRFSRHKSAIKYYEYSINHWPGVYQTYLYGDVVKHGETGFLATTQDEWYKYMKLLFDDEQLRRQLAENAYRDVKDNHTFRGRRRDEWLQVYRRASEASRTGSESFFVG